MRKLEKVLPQIIRDSDLLESIMVDLLVEIPGLFRLSSYDKVKESVFEFICSDEPLSSGKCPQVNKFDLIMDKHLNGGVGLVRKKKVSESKRLADKLRTKLSEVIRNKHKNDEFLSFLGCSRERLLKHIEDQFEPGMTWENRGLNTWHIDHTEPLCSFDLRDPDMIKQVCNFNNLRPMWAKDNIVKGKEDAKKSVRRVYKV